jgi:RHS repeat-associated protein
MKLYLLGFMILIVQICLGQTQYQYDGNGNIIADSYNGIAFIQYDINNLPIAIYKTDGTKMEYSYDVGGERVRKYDGTANTYYVHGANGQTEAVTKDDPTATVFHIDDIGYAQMQGSAWTRAYYLKDHLGSVRMTVLDIGGIIGYDDYYPFGMIMPRRSSNSGNAAGRYKFTGKERDVETGFDYFGARYYDSRIARWLSVDPLAGGTPGWTPYRYCFNNPLIFLDLDGNEEVYDKGYKVDPVIVTANRLSTTDYFNIQHLTIEKMIADIFSRTSGDGISYSQENGKLWRYTDVNGIYNVNKMVVPEILGSVGESPIKITEIAIKHILNRHTVGGLTTTGKSIFSEGENIAQLIKAAEGVTPVGQAGGNFARTVDAGRIIGVDRTTGAATSVYTIITNAANDLITAFPGRP